MKFNKQLTALAFLTLIATSGTVPAIATQAQTPAKQLCWLRAGIKPVCTVLVTAPIGVAIRSGPSSNYPKIGNIPYQHDVNVRVTNRTYASYISTIHNLGISAIFSTQRCLRRATPTLMLRINQG